MLRSGNMLIGSMGQTNKRLRLLSLKAV